MKQPQIIKCSDFISLCYSQTQIKNRWLPARPLPYYFCGIESIVNRIKLSYGVLVGKYDAVDWEK